MSSTYSGSSVLHGSIVIPSDGDPAISESVNVALRALQDTTVYLTTTLGHQMADDRGKTSTLIGDFIINDGGGSFQVQVPSTFGGTVDFTNDVVIHTAGGLINAGTSDLRGDVTVGGSGAQNFTVNATTQFNSPVFVHADLQSGHEIQAASLVITGDADLEGNTQLDTVAVSSTLDVTGETTLRDVLRVRASTHIGNSSTQNHEFTGGVTFDQGVLVQGDATVNGTVTLNGSGNELGSSAAVGVFETRGDTTIGNSSADTLLLNALLSSPMGFRDAGRVLRRPTVLSADTAITPVSGDTIIVRGTQTVTMDNTTAEDGDWFMLLSIASAATIQYPSYDGSTRSMSMGLNQAAFFVFLDFYGGWLGGKWSFTPGS